MASQRSLREVALERTFSLYVTHFALWLALLLPVDRDRIGDLPGRPLGDHRDARARTPRPRWSRDRWPPPGPRCWSGDSPASAGDNLRAARAGSPRQPRRQHGAVRGAAAGAAPAGDGERARRRDRRHRPGRAGGGGRRDLLCRSWCCQPSGSRPARRGRCRC